MWSREIWISWRVRPKAIKLVSPSRDAAAITECDSRPKVKVDLEILVYSRSSLTWRSSRRLSRELPFHHKPARDLTFSRFIKIQSRRAIKTRPNTCESNATLKHWKLCLIGISIQQKSFQRWADSQSKNISRNEIFVKTFLSHSTAQLLRKTL